MQRGRRAKPTAVKKLEGNRGKRKLNAREPKPAAPVTLTPPEWLGPVAIEYWHRLAPRLEKLGVLTELDVDLLALLCDAWQKKHEARETIDKCGGYHYTESGFIVAHPAMAQEHKANELIRKLNTELGLTPSSRAGMEVKTREQSGKLSKYLANAKA
jgi:P27 family predicted phage terminase small subunit